VINKQANEKQKKKKKEQEQKEKVEKKAWKRLTVLLRLREV
jgi:hypothetical protein